jgi:hypothetical protein
MNNGKAKIEHQFDGLRISIPSKKNWFALIFGTAWMGGWFFGLVSVSSMFTGDQVNNAGIGGFMLFWTIAWTAGGAAIATILLWGFFGQESFRESGDQFLFEKTVFGIGKKVKLQKREIKNFRVALGIDSTFGGSRWAFWGLGPGKIKFDYGFKTYSFGLGVDDAEADYLVEMLNEKFRQEYQG